MKNCYRIIAKDIGIKDTFKELIYEIVNNMQLIISIKFKNKYSIQSMSVKESLKYFNQQKEVKNEKPEYIPKKLKIPNIFQEIKKETPKQKYPKKMQGNNFNKQKEQKNEFKKDEELKKKKKPKNGNFK